MKTLKLDIKAEDIHSTDWYDQKNCAITRALNRAGLDAREVGKYVAYLKNILEEDRDFVVSAGLAPKVETPTELDYTVRAMYAHTGAAVGVGLVHITPKDFTYEIQIPEEWEINEVHQ